MNVSDLIGIPYQVHGETHEGCDCLGLVRIFYREILGREFPDFRDLYNDPRNYDAADKTISEQQHQFERVRDPQGGDVVLFRVGRFACHVGILIDATYFIHNQEGASSAVERLDSEVWRHRIVGVFRPRDISG
jgi:cell wall-associated NlpC family hydrolase